MWFQLCKQLQKASDTKRRGKYRLWSLPLAPHSEEFSGRWSYFLTISESLPCESACNDLPQNHRWSRCCRKGDGEEDTFTVPAVAGRSDTEQPRHQEEGDGFPEEPRPFTSPAPPLPQPSCLQPITHPPPRVDPRTGLGPLREGISNSRHIVLNWSQFQWGGWTYSGLYRVE